MNRDVREDAGVIERRQSSTQRQSSPTEHGDDRREGRGALADRRRFDDREAKVVQAAVEPLRVGEQRCHQLAALVGANHAQTLPAPLRPRRARRPP